MNELSVHISRLPAETIFSLIETYRTKQKVCAKTFEVRGQSGPWCLQSHLKPAPGGIAGALQICVLIFFYAERHRVADHVCQQ